jgi:hypothetical protein
MKKYLLLLLPSLFFAQTPTQRQAIVAKYSAEKTAELKSKYAAYFAEQHALINDYKAKNGIVDSEKKSLQRMFAGHPIFFTTDNAGAAITINTVALYPGGELGLDVTGVGMVGGIWDGGKVRTTHQELSGKVVIGDNTSTLSDHSTHVSGTVAAKGISPTRRGMAYNAHLFTNDWDSDELEMIDFAGNSGGLVSNHSYGYVASSLQTWMFGKYDQVAVDMDHIMYTYPYYQVVNAAGNDRSDNTLSQVDLKNGFDLITGIGSSKNSITVAAIDEIDNYMDYSDVTVASFSNFGPTDDGRIKPNIASKGVAVSSCISTANDAYASFDGTSMATPGITGLVLLLQDYYNMVNGDFMKSATVRGLIYHSAREAGNDDGPDYQTGWGVANAGAAAVIIQNAGTTAIVEEDNLAEGATFTKTIALATAQKLEVSISWTDPEGAVSGNTPDDTTPNLVNNLDVKVLKDGVTYHPWKLNPAEPISEATRDSDNDVDNYEKIQIDSAAPGVYTIQVTHKATLQDGSQDFTLIATGDADGLLANKEFNYADNILLYPNPANNTLSFSLPNNIVVTDATLFDETGKKVATNSQLLNNSIDVSQLSSGLYFVTLGFDGKSVTKKFVKN